MRQNGLSGKHSNPIFKSIDKGETMITMGISPELKTGLTALGGFASMGALSVRIYIKNENFTEHDGK